MDHDASRHESPDPPMVFHTDEFDSRFRPPSFSPMSPPIYSLNFRPHGTILSFVLLPRNGSSRFWLLLTLRFLPFSCNPISPHRTHGYSIPYDPFFSDTASPRLLSLPRFPSYEISLFFFLLPILCFHVLGGRTMKPFFFILFSLPDTDFPPLYYPNVRSPISFPLSMNIVCHHGSLLLFILLPPVP